MLSDLIYFLIGMIIYLRYQMVLKTILRAFSALNNFNIYFVKECKTF
nr:MAG TPA: hypothetical protein [Caudoviricetes sp.]